MTGNRLTAALMLLPALIAVLLYLPATGFDFINFDDPLYVYQHPAVTAGWTRASLAEIWTSYNHGNWQPLTLMSHAADVTLFGLKPGPHHAVSIAIHAVNTCLLFLLISRWTGSRAAAFLTALFWSVHPMNVDPVAWVSQRKTLLAVFFGLLALLRYLRYREKPSRLNGLLIFAMLLLGLLAKGILVTLPVVMLVSFEWLRDRSRFTFSRQGATLAAALLSVSALFGWLVMLGQHGYGSIVTTDSFPLSARTGYAAMNTVLYMVKIVWPFGLALHYPPPESAPHPAAAAGAAALLLLFTAIAWKARERKWWLIAGWSWFLVSLAPLSGLIATGQAIRSDRFMYMAGIGLFMIAGRTMASGLARSPRIWRVLVALLFILCAWRARDQLMTWRNGHTVYQHALSVTRDNALVRNNLAAFYLDWKRADLAAPHLVESLRIFPGDPQAQANLAITLLAPEGRRALAFHLDEIKATRPDDTDYLLVRFMIAMVQRREQDAAELWNRIMQAGQERAGLKEQAEQIRDACSGMFGVTFDFDTAAEPVRADPP